MVEADGRSRRPKLMAQADGRSRAQPPFPKTLGAPLSTRKVVSSEEKADSVSSTPVPYRLSSPSAKTAGNSAHSNFL